MRNLASFILSLILAVISTIVHGQNQISTIEPTNRPYDITSVMVDTSKIYGTELGGSQQIELSDRYFVSNNLLNSNSIEYGYYPFEGPYQMVTTGELSNFTFADDFDGEGNLYALAPLHLWKIDPQSGEVTVIGPLQGMPTTFSPSGLSFDPVSGNMYALAGPVNSFLFQIDTSTGEMTPIGPTGIGFGAWLEIDNNGTAFCAGISEDNLYSIDLSTGQSTLIGPLGEEINFAQEATVDPVTNILYAGLFNGTPTELNTRLAEINKLTGEATILGSMGVIEQGLLSVAPEGVLNLQSSDTISFSFYPNPVQDMIIFENPGTIEKIGLYNMLGQQILNFNISSSDRQLSLASLINGVYIMKVTMNGQVGTYKVIKR